MVTAITFKSPVSLDRQEFDDIDHFLQYVFHMRNDDVDQNFHELPQNQISDKLQEKVNNSKKKNITSFTSLSS